MVSQSHDIAVTRSGWMPEPPTGLPQPYTQCLRSCTLCYQTSPQSRLGHGFYQCRANGGGCAEIWQQGCPEVSASWNHQSQGLHHGSEGWAWREIAVGALADPRQVGGIGEGQEPGSPGHSQQRPNDSKLRSVLDHSHGHLHNHPRERRIVYLRR
jgi:hypothetical protein